MAEQKRASDLSRGVKDPTFVVKVQYQQNASWQGTITWVEGGIDKHFRSTLELIKLMDDAIADDEKESTSWF